MKADGLDYLEISDLSVRAIIGILPEERRTRQQLRLTITMGTRTGPAAQSDRIADAVDYRAATKRVIEQVEGSSYRLLESLAEAVAACVLQDPGVETVRVRIEKPGALRFARTVSVEITRER